MNKHELNFDDWTKEHRLHLGVQMIHLCELLGLVKVGNMKLNKMKTVTYVQPTPKIIREIKNFNIKNEALFPKYMPMKMCPRRWTSPFIGGYYGKKHNFENKPKDIINALQSSKSK
jgi:DNA-directed RNA polymerase